MAIEFRTKFWPAMKDGPPGIGTKLSERYFNPIWTRIDNRLHALEELRISWVTATNELIAFGLQRIDSVLAPAFIRVGKIATLGFLIAHSTTPETLVQDQISTFVIDDPDERELFHPSSFVTIEKPGIAGDYAVGQVSSYNRTTGLLDVTIRQIVGDPGPYADWEISTGSGIPLLMRQQLADARAARDAAYSSLRGARAAVKSLNNQIGIAIHNAGVARAKAAIATDAATVAVAARNDAVEAAAQVDAPGINSRLDTVETTLATKASTTQLNAAIAASARVTARSVYLTGF